AQDLKACLDELGLGDAFSRAEDVEVEAFYLTGNSLRGIGSLRETLVVRHKRGRRREEFFFFYCPYEGDLLLCRNAEARFFVKTVILVGLVGFKDFSGQQSVFS